MFQWLRMLQGVWRILPSRGRRGGYQNGDFFCRMTSHSGGVGFDRTTGTVRLSGLQSGFVVEGCCCRWRQGARASVPPAASARRGPLYVHA